MQVNEVQSHLDKLKSAFFKLVSYDNPQQRGFALEKVLKGLFDLSISIQRLIPNNG